MSADELRADNHQPGGEPDWWIYRGTGRPLRDIDLAEILPPPPPWRRYGGPLPSSDGHPPEDDGEAIRRLGSEFRTTRQHVDPHELDMVNASLYLRRPLLLTGKPGVGKSALAYRIAQELRLGRVLKWSISTHTTLESGLYRYDAIGRLQAAAQRADSTDISPIGDFLRLGPLGTAFLPRRLPRVLLIDELDKSEADLPNNLLNLFEDGEFTIDELARVRHSSSEMTVHTADPNETATVADGRVRCYAFPIVIMTSNGEREFPPAFLRRALQLEIKDPNVDQLAAMVASHLLDPDGLHSDALVREFVEKSRAEGGIPADRLLDAVYLATSGAYKPDGVAWPRLIDSLWHRLSTGR